MVGPELLPPLALAGRWVVPLPLSMLGFWLHSAAVARPVEHLHMSVALEVGVMLERQLSLPHCKKVV